MRTAYRKQRASSILRPLGSQPYGYVSCAPRPDRGVRANGGST